MWVFTKDGYFSVIAFDPTKARGELGANLIAEALNMYEPDDALVLVRARAEDDLERLANYFERRWEWKPAIFSSTKKNSDYPHRMLLDKDEWSMYLAYQTAELDYTNFKDMVTEELGQERHDTYLRVWGVLHDLSHEGEERFPKHQQVLDLGFEEGSFGGQGIRTDSSAVANKE